MKMIQLKMLMLLIVNVTNNKMFVFVIYCGNVAHLTQELKYSSIDKHVIT